MNSFSSNRWIEKLFKMVALMNLVATCCFIEVVATSSFWKSVNKNIQGSIRPSTSSTAFLSSLRQLKTARKLEETTFGVDIIIEFPSHNGEIMDSDAISSFESDTLTILTTSNCTSDTLEITSVEVDWQSLSTRGTIHIVGMNVNGTVDEEDSSKARRIVVDCVLDNGIIIKESYKKLVGFPTNNGAISDGDQLGWRPSNIILIVCIGVGASVLVGLVIFGVYHYNYGKNNAKDSHDKYHQPRVGSRGINPNGNVSVISVKYPRSGISNQPNKKSLTSYCDRSSSREGPGSVNSNGLRPSDEFGRVGEFRRTISGHNSIYNEGLTFQPVLASLGSRKNDIEDGDSPSVDDNDKNKNHDTPTSLFSNNNNNNNNATTKINSSSSVASGKASVKSNKSGKISVASGKHSIASGKHSITSGLYSSATSKRKDKRGRFESINHKIPESISLADSSQRLIDITSRYKRQIENITRETARWQNDMHLKLSKLSMLCNDLNEESVKRKEQADTALGELDNVRNERDSKSSELEILRVRVQLYEKQEVENAEIRRLLRENENETLEVTDNAIQERDDIISDLTVRLNQAFKMLETERQRRQVIFPNTRKPEDGNTNS
mmetsp:Transcript_13304/g.16176  ORF Transcript_13304/g.16176 Transcript_13304/m.16176 type:complete len:609 (+) Transcript_13304:56-1882(+)